MIPVIATFLIISANSNDILVLKTKLIQFIGKVSYSLYLWHWPVFVIAQYLGVEMTVTSISLMVLISLIAAYISYKYVETVNFNTSKVVLVALSILVLGTRFLSIVPANKSMYKAKTLALSNYKRAHSKETVDLFYLGKCFISKQSTFSKDYNQSDCLKIDSNKRNVMLLGDSHAADIAQSLEASLSKMGIHIMKAASSGCLPIYKPNGETQCSDMMNFIFNEYFPLHYKKIDGVIISANWVKVPEDQQEALISDLKKTIQVFKNYHIPTVIVGQNETYRIPYSVIVARECEYNIINRTQYLDANALKTNKLLLHKLTNSYIDIYNYKSVPSLSINNDPYMLDENHFTKYGANITVQKIISTPPFINFLQATSQRL
ncbi:acyltransferase [Mucilaginibacter robiniae]|uniref:Acyltransferase n=1 Tax=Mucilaginibacter robiniae TaxID=2728022 RepID=A0A7L5E0V4_9SPHI|nr:acyltransferase family protein [Mucilaginibacter robiniae]QJD95174.1 acyltransferase [Mucilaginibacter robiniae]